jgi:hypothetical protein
MKQYFFKVTKGFANCQTMGSCHFSGNIKPKVNDSHWFCILSNYVDIASQIKENQEKFFS